MVKGLVSIITPCYNGARYISETIDAVMEIGKCSLLMTVLKMNQPK